MVRADDDQAAAELLGLAGDLLGGRALDQSRGRDAGRFQQLPPDAELRARPGRGPPPTRDRRRSRPRRLRPRRRPPAPPRPPWAGRRSPAPAARRAPGRAWRRAPWHRACATSSRGRSSSLISTASRIAPVLMLPSRRSGDSVPDAYITWRSPRPAIEELIGDRMHRGLEPYAVRQARGRRRVADRQGGAGRARRCRDRGRGGRRGRARPLWRRLQPAGLHELARAAGGGRLALRRRPGRERLRHRLGRDPPGAEVDRRGRASSWWSASRR